MTVVNQATRFADFYASSHRPVPQASSHKPDGKSSSKEHACDTHDQP